MTKEQFEKLLDTLGEVIAKLNDVYTVLAQIAKEYDDSLPL